MDTGTKMLPNCIFSLSCVRIADYCEVVKVDLLSDTEVSEVCAPITTQIYCANLLPTDAVVPSLDLGNYSKLGGLGGSKIKAVVKEWYCDVI